MSKIKDCKHKKCEKCKGRTALMTGLWYYRPDEEPYVNAIKEDSIAEEGDIYLSAYKCDKCGHLQNIGIA